MAGVLKRDDVDGVVVTHGTDTMAKGACFLDLTMNSDKPVVFAGAMNNAPDPNPDGPGDLCNAVVQAVSPSGLAHLGHDPAQLRELFVTGP